MDFQDWTDAVIRVIGNDSAFRHLQLCGKHDTLNLYIDQRSGRYEGVIYLYAPAGETGSKMANADEAAFIEERIKACTLNS